MHLVSKALRSPPQWAWLGAACLATMLACAAVLYYAYLEGRSTAQEAASAVFAEATGRVEVQVGAFLGRALSRASINAAAPAADSPISADGRTHPAYKLLAATAETNPSLYAAYYGHPDGAFLEVIAVRGSSQIARALKAPSGAHLAVRTNRVDPAGQRREHWVFLDRSKAMIGQREVPNPTYDPRSSAWYRGAMAASGPTLVGPYQFSSFPEPGITASHRLPGGGVFGLDFTLDELGRLATDRPVSKRGRIYLFDDRSRVIAAPAQGPGAIAPTRRLETIATLGDPVLLALDDLRRTGEVGRTAWRRIDGQLYAVSVSPTRAGGLNIGIAAPLDDFGARLRHFLVQLTVVTGMVLGLAVLVVARFASQTATLAVSKRELLDRSKDLETANQKLEAQSRALEARAGAAAAERGQLQRLLDTAPVGIGISTGGILRYANGRMRDLTDLKAGDPVESVYSCAADREAVMSRLRWDHPVLNQELEVIGPDAAKRQVLASYVTHEYDGQDAVLTWMADITERQEAENTLRRSEAYNKVLFQESHIPIVVMDPETARFVDCNRAAAKIYGYEEREEVIGKSPLETSTPTQYDGVETAAAAQAIMARVIEDGHAAFEWRGQRPDGSVWDCFVNLMRFQVLDRDMLQFTLEDITERKAAQRAFQENRQLLESILENTMALIYAKDRDGRYMFVNRTFEEVCNLKREDVIGRTDFDVMPPKDAAEYRRNDLAAMASGVATEIEEALSTPDREVVFLSRKVPIFSADGMVEGICGISTDITDRKHAEVALRESEENFRALADNISQFVWTADASGEIYWYSKRWHDYAGTTLEDMQGWGWRKVHHPDHVDRVVERITYSFETGVPWEDTFPLRGKDGVYRWFLSRALPIRNEAGEIVRWFGTNTDVTEQIEAETALRISVERQTATADILKVIAGSPSDVGPVFEAIAERSNRLIGGHSTAIFRIVGDMAHLAALTPGDPEIDAAMRASFPQPVAAYPLFEMVRDGRPLEIPDVEADVGAQTGTRDLGRLRGVRGLLLTPLMNDQGLIGLISVTRQEPGAFASHHVEILQTFADQAAIAIENQRMFDELETRTRDLSISLQDLRAAQGRLVQTEKLASLGQLTAGIAHEIKNPLNFVNNFAALSADLTEELNELLEAAEIDGKTREGADEITALLKGNLEKVVQHGKRADSIVKNMLLHSRDGGGELRPSDINALLEESLNLAYHGARAETPSFNITLKRDFDPEAGVIDAYPQELTRVFLNLLTNGFYAATKRKEAGVEGFEPTLSATTRSLGDQVEVRIRDNGIGIPPEVKDKMFNPFFTTKPAGEGTGLGLSMSHDIVVKQHVGAIDVASEPGAFTEFVVTLPRTVRAQAQVGGAS